MDGYLDAQLENTIAPDVLNMCIKLGPCSPSQYKNIHLQANLENYPLADLKCTLNGNHFGCSTITTLHNYVKNITLFCIKLIPVKSNTVYKK